ncbi:MAG: FecR family protein, partial [Paludibacter sp.]
MKTDLHTQHKMETDNLLAKYFGGNATEQEQNQLEDWIAASPENEQEFLRLTKLYELVGSGRVSKQNFDLAIAKTNFENYMQQTAQMTAEASKHISINVFTTKQKWYFAAATIALFITISNFVFRANSDREVVLASTTKPIETKLADETKITLSTNSTITYKANYATDNKELALNGEALFDVGGKGNGKLRITAGETFIEDIGTVFQVTAYPSADFVQVKVTEGLVKFYTADNKGVTIRTHETALYDKQTKKFRHLANSTVQNGIETIVLNLDGVTIKQAIEIISNAYNVNLQFDGNGSSDKQITVSFVN